MQENIRFLLSMEICCYILVIFICCWPKRVKCKPFHMIWKKPQKTCNFHNWHKKGQWGVRRLINWHKKGSEDLITGKKNLSRGGWGGWGWVQRTYGETTAVWEYERSSLLPRDSTSVKDWVAIALRALLSTFRSPETLSLRT